MTYALIDNATITAVQRIMGTAPTRSTDNTDVDIIALDNMLQAILFYDEITAIDDYKPEFQTHRKQQFSHIRFLDSSQYTLPAIKEYANQKASELLPEIRGGEFTNSDFKNFFGMLQTNIICTWDMSSSVYYLTLKMLGEARGEEFEKYGKIAAAIFSELQDCRNSSGVTKNDVLLYDSAGNKIDKDYKINGYHNGERTQRNTGGMTDALKAFTASLIWIANRSIYYTNAAHYLHADSILYPIRQAYQQHYFQKTLQLDSNHIQSLIKKTTSSISQDIVEITNNSRSANITFEVPVIAAYLINQCDSPEHILVAANDLRNRPILQEFRGILREIRNTLDDGDRITLNKKTQQLTSDIRKCSDSIRGQFGIKTQSGVPIKKIVQCYNTHASMIGLPTFPEYDGKIPLPQFMNKSKKSGLSLFYSDVTNDLSQIWALGKAKDRLGSKVYKERGKEYNPKAESPRYRKVHSEWKSPM